MTNTSRRHGSPQYQSPDLIRGEMFRRRLRGLDQDEVYGYLDVLADQVESTAKDLSTARAENERLQDELRRSRADLQRVQAELDEYEAAGDRVNEQVVQMFSQAQLVVEEMVQDVSRDARERIGQARAHERMIVEQAMDAAGEHVRSYARTAQAQMQSIMDSFATEVDRLDSTARSGESGATAQRAHDPLFDDLTDWQLPFRNESDSNGSGSF